MFPSLPEARSGGAQGPAWDHGELLGRPWLWRDMGGTRGPHCTQQRETEAKVQRPQSTFLNLETQVHLNQQGKGPRSRPETPGSDQRV